MFLDLTPIEFHDALKDKTTHEKELVTAHVRIICETIRRQTLHLINSNRERGKGIRDERKLMWFEWESQPIIPAQTQEQMKAVMKAIAKGFNKKKEKHGKDNGRNVRRKPNRLSGS